MLYKIFFYFVFLKSTANFIYVDKSLPEKSEQDPVLNWVKFEKDSKEQLSFKAGFLNPNNTADSVCNVITDNVVNQFMRAIWQQPINTFKNKNRFWVYSDIVIIQILFSFRYYIHSNIAKIQILFSFRYCFHSDIVFI